MAGEEADPQALVLDAVAGGPVPLHVVIQKTGLRSHEVAKAAATLTEQGKVLTQGNMIGPPEPSYVPPTEEYVPEAEEGEPKVFDGSVDDAVPSTYGPDVPVERPPVGPEPQDFFVATGYRQLLAGSAQEAADRMMEEQNMDEVLVVPVEQAEIYERATVTRRKT